MSFRARCSEGDDRRAGASACGSALVIVLLALLFMSALGAAMVILATADTMAAGNQRDARVVQYAAEAAIERAADEVVRLANWTAVLSGVVRSARVDGPSSGPRQLPDGRLVVLEQVANLANCGTVAACTSPSLTALTGDRPWGANNPHWRLFAHEAPAGGSPLLPVYVVVLVGDDPLESDGDPERDGPSGTAGFDVLQLRVEAFGPSGSRRTVEAVVARDVVAGGAVAPRFLSWRSPIDK